MLPIRDPVYSDHVLVYVPEDGYVTHHFTGSYYICNPPVTNTDRDVLVLVKDREEYQSALLKQGWSGCTGYEDKETHFFAARKGNYNLIVTDEVEWYTKFAAATELAKHMNLKDKNLRIELFQLVLAEVGTDTKAVITTKMRIPFGWKDPRLFFGA